MRNIHGLSRSLLRRVPPALKDALRLEGGGRIGPWDTSALVRQWPLLAVLATAGIGLLVTALDAFRVGLLLIGAAMLGGATLRWLLPRVGMLAVRSRFTDIATYGVLGVAIVLLALMAQPDPWLEIPFLDDALHFTISS
ncbi:DUF3017 domain-containing protein [Streptomyces thermodiastaticus]|jgi:hypothetical protein|nr:DUF3017 domain-containing protein [Streptomyces thermodiastaticus]MCE7550174.1 DUF3017 domain-containing protein [Streptomyces thermodiastaticus]